MVQGPPGTCQSLLSIEKQSQFSLFLSCLGITEKETSCLVSDSHCFWFYIVLYPLQLSRFNSHPGKIINKDTKRLRYQIDRTEWSHTIYFRRVKTHPCCYNTRPSLGKEQFHLHKCMLIFSLPFIRYNLEVCLTHSSTCHISDCKHVLFHRNYVQYTNNERMTSCSLELSNCTH